MGTRKREVRFELLRIVAMCMVITLHYLNHTGLLPSVERGGLGGSRGILALLLESFCIVAVNVYVMISGYFLPVSGFRICRLLQLVAEIYFYSLLIPVILLAAGVETGGLQEGIYAVLPWFFPLQTEHYWFATSYVILYLLTPLLNAACRHLRKEAMALILLLLLVWFSISKSILPVAMVTDDYGYGFGWFVCVYLTGAYVRFHGLPWQKKQGRALTVYLICSLLTFLLGLGSFLLYEKTGSFGYVTGLPYHYNFILCYIGAAALFLTAAGGSTKRADAVSGKEAGSRKQAYTVSGKEEKSRETGTAAGASHWRGQISRWICRISPLTFGVYLMHEHVLVRQQWTVWIQQLTGPVTELSAGLVLLHWILSVLAVFFLGCILGACRKLFFSAVGKVMAGRRWDRYLRRWDRYFS